MPFRRGAGVVQPPERQIARAAWTAGEPAAQRQAWTGMSMPSWTRATGAALSSPARSSLPGRSVPLALRPLYAPARPEEGPVPRSERAATTGALARIHSLDLIVRVYEVRALTATGRPALLAAALLQT